MYQTLENSIQGTPMDSEKSADEWAPQAVPQFGKITLLGGFTDYKLSTVLTTGQAYDSGNSLSPTFHLGGELWITPQYFANISLEQLFFTGYNSLVGSSPANLSYTVNTMDLLFGYKYSLDGNFWGPSLLGSAGYISKSTKMSDSSPTAFSSFDTSGFQLQVGGYFPVTEKNDVGFGANVKYLLTTQFSESPVNSGSASPTLSQFDIYGNYSYTPNINFKGEIVFSAVNSTFGNGASRANPARSIEEKVTSYLLGIEYLF